MSIHPMTKRCVYCHRIYTYNLSTGDFGTFCKLCGRGQERPLMTTKPPKVQATTIPRFRRKPGESF